MHQCNTRLESTTPACSLPLTHLVANAAALAAAKHTLRGLYARPLLLSDAVQDCMQAGCAISERVLAPAAEVVATVVLCSCCCWCCVQLADGCKARLSPREALCVMMMVQAGTASRRR